MDKYQNQNQNQNQNNNQNQIPFIRSAGIS